MKFPILSSQDSPKARFYAEVAKILGCSHDFHVQAPLVGKRGRWQRRPGNGRFAGCGLVRFFSQGQIQVALTHPRLSGSYESPEAALAAIARALDNESRQAP